MKKRPLSITLIAWFLIISGAFSFITTLTSINNPIVKELMAKSPIPFPIQYAIMYIGLFVTIICGIGILKKQNWARFLYIVWGIIGIFSSLFTSPIKLLLIPSLIFLIIVVFFLFRPVSNQYFTESEVSLGT